MTARRLRKQVGATARGLRPSKRLGRSKDRQVGTRRQPSTMGRAIELDETSEARRPRSPPLRRALAGGGAAGAAVELRDSGEAIGYFDRPRSTATLKQFPISLQQSQRIISNHVCLILWRWLVEQLRKLRRRRTSVQLKRVRQVPRLSVRRVQKLVSSSKDCSSSF